MADEQTDTPYEPPCIGLDPDTDPCPFCGAWLSDPRGDVGLQANGELAIRN